MTLRQSVALLRIGSRRRGTRSLRRPGLVRGFAVALVSASFAVCLTAAVNSSASVTFKRRCTACHTYGRGVKVGPDLKRVTDRRERPWLVAFIRSSSKLIQSGDPTAAPLFRKFKQERMPDWSDLSVGEVEGLIEYLKADGPEQKEPDERHASTATPAEVAKGRQLFHSQSRLKYGKQACNACHSIRDSIFVSGGSLGPDLSVTYLKYQDKALTDFLRLPCFPQQQEAPSGRYLTPQEAFDLKAYLAQVAGLQISAANTGRVLKVSQ